MYIAVRRYLCSSLSCKDFIKYSCTAELIFQVTCNKYKKRLSWKNPEKCWRKTAFFMFFEETTILVKWNYFLIFFRMSRFMNYSTIFCRIINKMEKIYHANLLVLRHVRKPKNLLVRKILCICQRKSLQTFFN